MPFEIPLVSPPIDAFAICIAVPFDTNPDVVDLFPPTRKTAVNKPDETRPDLAIRLLLDKFDSKTGHFHIDAALRPTEATTIALEDIQAKFDRLALKSLVVNIEGHFLIPTADIAKESLLGAWRHVVLNAGGMQTQLVSGNVRLNDSIFRELRWRPATKANQTRTAVELIGSLGVHPVSPDIMIIGQSKLDSAFSRLVQSRGR